jgi:hypothetical protein
MKKSSNKNRMILINNAGRCAIVFLIIMGLASFGAMWFVVTKVPELQKELAEKKAGESSQQTDQYNWNSISANLIAKFDGKILSINKLDSLTCYAILSSDISNDEAANIAEKIGYYILNATGGKKGGSPPVHVFIDGKHIAVAQPSGMDYIGKVSLQNWGP